MIIEKVFSERQHFKQFWLWALLLTINAIFIYGLASQVFFGHPFSDKPIRNDLLLFVTSGTLMFTLLFVFLRLDTKIQKDGVYYRFLPFQLSFKNISWDRISKSYVRQYKPISEYGGWGIRIGFFGKGKAFNVSGNKGLQLDYDNGKKLLIGTQLPEEIKQVLQQLGRTPADN